MTTTTDQQAQLQANRSIGIFASIKHVITTICRSLVGACTLVDTTIDMAQDLADAGKLTTLLVKQQAQANANSQLEELNKA